MAKSKANKRNSFKKKSAKITASSKQRKVNWIRILIILGIIVTVIVLIIKPDFNRKPEKTSSERSQPKFKKEGELTFFKGSNNEKIKTIDIEIAEDNYERAMGLMYRTKMNDRSGMLFIMEQEEPQSFWMKNTYISLDIIFLNKDLEIVKIQKYTQPLSEDSYPSFKKSKYVVEVVAGFCDLFDIEEGDYIRYKRSSRIALN